IVMDGRLQVHGLTTSDAELLVPAVDGDKAVVVRVAASDLSLSPVSGIDPSAGLLVVDGDLLASSEPVPGSWDDAVTLAHRALASELVGCGRAMLELARTHALDREQFGRPIAAFQAIRHRLADALVALQAAHDLIAAAWEDGLAMSAAMAKALAGRSARTAARHCQQVLAGIGFTIEHRLHLYVRRVLLLDQLLGSSRTLTKQLGEELLASRTLPPLLPL
ncbi:MAG: acyl-CoA dehydrogenase family protein, partial [Mycobacteriales bacterium]